MKAILVTVEITTRIIVDDDFDTDNMRDEDYDTIRDKAYPRLIDNLKTDAVGDHLTEVVPDEEIPFGELQEDRNEYPNDVPWSYNHDSAEAFKEGWDVFSSEGSADGPFQIQKSDDMEIFATDEDAIKHVIKKAKEGSRLHQRALDYVSARNPKEAKLIKRLS